MLYIVYDDMTECTEEDVRRLIPLVQDSRREKALRYKHLFGQWSTLKSAEMLNQLLCAENTRSGECSCHEGEEWQYNEYGKPYLKNGPEFSISHCKNAIAVAVDERPIGIDVESIRPYNESLALRVMNEAEMKEIEEAAELPCEGAGDLDMKALAFTRIWTQKEAVLKLRGTGIIDDLKQVLVNAPEKLTTTVNIDKKYVLTIAES